MQVSERLGMIVKNDKSSWPTALLECLQGGYCAQQISQGRAAGIGDAYVVVEPGRGVKK
jgi:hypothetical protein